MSQLAAGLAALVAGVVAWVIGDAEISPTVQALAAGAIGLIGTALFPAWKAQFDEAKAQLVSVVTLVIVLGLDWLITVQLHLSDATQSTLLAIITAAASLLAPNLALQQATRFRSPASQGDSRPPS